jgi:peptidoglycan/LPS O-acetylase OafA/YrhL
VKKLIPSSETSKPQRNNFDAIRLAMAMLVVWSHSFALHLGSEKTEWISLLLNGTYNAGNIGVMAFFVISGFLITQSWERSKTARSYFEKRVKRIYPGYLVATSICAFIIAPLFGGVFPNAPMTIGLNLLLQNSIPLSFPHNVAGPGVNGSLWSIPFEFWCYIGVAVGGWLVLKRPRLLIAICLLLIFGKVIQDLTGKKPSTIIGVIFGWPYIWTKIGPSFVLGMIAYSYRSVLPRSRLILLGLMALTIVGYVAFSERLPLHRAAAFGDFSYGSYLYAFPIQQMIQATVGPSLGLPEFIALAMVLSLLAGILSWHLVEKHFMRRSPARDRQITSIPVAGGFLRALLQRSSAGAGN